VVESEVVSLDHKGVGTGSVWENSVLDLLADEKAGVDCARNVAKIIMFLSKEYLD
jgi:hypothetical protein